MRKVHLMSTLILSALSYSSFAEEFMMLDFDLGELAQEECATKSALTGEIGKLSATIKDPKFWKAYVGTDQRLDNAIIVIPVDKELLQGPEVMRTMGMTAKESLTASGDNFHVNGCSEGHDQGTMNNRFCHSAIARTFAAWLETKGVSKVVSSLAGGVFWVPKEYFVDLNPSAHDVAYSYTDNLGTKSTTFEFTVFGDAFFKHYMGKDFAPFKSSTPFITIKRKFKEFRATLSFKCNYGTSKPVIK